MMAWAMGQTVQEPVTCVRRSFLIFVIVPPTPLPSKMPMYPKNMIPKMGFQSTWSMPTLDATAPAPVPGILPSSLP